MSEIKSLSILKLLLMILKTSFIRKTLFIASFIFINACSFEQPEYLTMITAAELNKTMQSEDVFLIDVHTPQQQHIKGTDLFIPYNQVEQYKAKLPKDKSKAIYVYCEGGPMGNTAARALNDLGYTNLINLQGGASAWRRSNFELE